MIETETRLPGAPVRDMTVEEMADIAGDATFSPGLRMEIVRLAYLQGQRDAFRHMENVRAGVKA